MFFPIMIDVERFEIVIVGGGKIGYRKAKVLIENGAKVTLISREINPKFYELDKEKLKIINKDIEEADLEKADIIYVATNNRQLNSKIAKYCLDCGKMVNSVDNHENSSFINTGFFKKEIEDNEVVVAVSSMGKSPSNTKKLRNKIEELVEKI